MQLVHVTPLSKAGMKETLTYFTAKPIAPGSIVAVPVRKKIVSAIVLRVEDVRGTKADLRSQAYSLKKVAEVKARNFFLPAFIAAAEKAAHYFATSSGAIIDALTPAAINDFAPALAAPKPRRENTAPLLTPVPESENTKQEILLLQSSDEERISAYKSVIREEFARGSSVFFCVPEISDIEKYQEALQKGIEEHVFVFSSAFTKKRTAENWKAALRHPHPALIIATGQYLSIPKEDIGALIIEKESSASYKTLARPFIDMRTFVRFFAKERGCKLILGDFFLRTETIYKRELGDCADLSSLKFRSISASESFIINMKPEKDAERKVTGPYQIISNELSELAKGLAHNNENLFIFASRRGLYPTTICADCGHTVSCSQCSAPLILHKDRTQKSNVSLCHKCGLTQRASDICASCGSWRLHTLGVGIEHAEEELLKIHPKEHILRVDKDSAKTPKQIAKVVDDFYASAGNILIATEMVLPYLREPVKNVAVLSMDGLFTIPDFGITEKIFNTLLRLRALASLRFLIQTREPENETLRYAAKGNLMDFYRDTIAERKELSYPPFSILVKISRAGVQRAVEQDMHQLAEVLAEYKPVLYPAFTATIKSAYRMNILLKIKSEEWPEKKVVDILRSLPPLFTVQVEPKDVL